MQGSQCQRLETFLGKCLELTMALIRLEDTLTKARGSAEPARDPPRPQPNGPTKYIPGHPIPAQPMFLEVGAWT